MATSNLFKRLLRIESRRCRVFFNFSESIVSRSFSCSSTSQTTGESEPAATSEESQFPSWYNTRSFEADEDAFHGYGAAIAADSTRSAQKAGSQATAELKSKISNRLESIRNDAVVELGSNSGLDSPKFIIAMRNAESDIASVAEVTETEVKGTNDGTFRAFAKATVDKEALIEELDKALAANGNAWNNLKESQAFSKF